MSIIPLLTTTWVVGVVALVVLLICLLVVRSIGNGRPHS